MTYASELYSWYANSLDADVYFCPERQGTYFGFFYLKDTDHVTTNSINPNLTTSAGITFELTLSPTQDARLNNLVAIQKPVLNEIVERRTEIAGQLRGFIVGEPPSLSQVLSDTERYGQLDGEISYNLATTFTTISQTLSSQQQTALIALRKQLLGDFPLWPGTGDAYRYSDPISMPAIENTDFLFLPGSQSKVYLPAIIR